MSKKTILFFLLLFHTIYATASDTTGYLNNIITELKKEWPSNKAINLVFHGHSVPAGYFKTPHVNTLHAYPQLVLNKIKEIYPNAVVNVIVTAIGGENSEKGAKRFDAEVLTHQPDVLFIDYALNDRGLGLEKSKAHWEEMIQKALQKNIKVILLTPSPDQSVDLNASDNILEQHSRQIIALSQQYGIGIADSYRQFANIARKKGALKKYMSQINHPNKKGHELIANQIIKYFIQ